MARPLVRSASQGGTNPVFPTEPMPLHRPVMLDESLAGLALRSGGIYVDGTFGRGGHSSAIIERLGSQGSLHAMDRDPEAFAYAQEHFRGLAGFHMHRRNFAELGALAGELQLIGRIDGILLDLGVSSPQFDDAQRGFSFSNDGPLDMRMDPDSGEPAAAWINRAEPDEIADVLYRYGEERASRRIARRIVDARAEAPITGTAQLADIIARAMPGPRQKIHPATRSFQAIRIFINRELDVLAQALEAGREVLAPGGRLAVISFHSLEDRIVKRFFREPAEEQQPTPYAASAQRRLRHIGRWFPSEQECAANPRARSAVLRVAEKPA